MVGEQHKERDGEQSGVEWRGGVGWGGAVGMGVAVWVLRHKNLINASLGCEANAEVKLPE